MSNLKIGDPAPELIMHLSTDKQAKLSDYQDSFVVLYFYPKDSTPGCTLEARDFNSSLAEFEKLGAKVIGVSKDSLKSHDKFRASHSLKFELGSDAEGATCENYGVWVEKSMFGKKYMGIQRATFLINKEGKIAYIWPNVSVMGHAKEVLEKIRELR